MEKEGEVRKSLSETGGGGFLEGHSSHSKLWDWGRSYSFERELLNIFCFLNKDAASASHMDLYKRVNVHLSATNFP